MNFKVPAKLRIKISKVLWITLIWVVIGFLETLNLHVLSSDFASFEKTQFYDFKQLLLLHLIGAFFGGIIAGSILVFYLRGRFRDKSFGVAVFLNTLILVLILLIFVGVPISLYNGFIYKDSPLNGGTFSNFLGIYRGLFFYRTLFFWLIIVFLTNLLLDINEKYGAGVLRQFIMGKYHHPREEERIFMFLDMKGSTTIAERIGHIQFFELLKDFFRDITDPILFTNGSIYQYIGDEVVIVWKMRSGTKNANSIRCFYNIGEAISAKKDYYTAKYGVVPEFKAAIHCGMVTIGEIGVLKKDIVFSGDVLNTTARMQSMCNDFGVRLLISKRLLKRMALPPDSLEAKKIGNISLKGKRKKVVLYTIEEGQLSV